MMLFGELGEVVEVRRIGLKSCVGEDEGLRSTV
jgi:hypothetical protein